jgi:hypothetical protein
VLSLLKTRFVELKLGDQKESPLPYNPQRDLRCRSSMNGSLHPPIPNASIGLFTGLFTFDLKTNLKVLESE